MRRELVLAVMVGAVALGGCTKRTHPGNVSDVPNAGGGEPYVENGEDPALARLQADLVASAGSDRVFFTFDAFSLSPEARATLTRQAQWLRQHPRAGFLVEGHADERGTREYNLALGDRRARAAADFLSLQGIAPNRITTISYGKERPEALGSDEASHAQNRRAVSVVIHLP
ncbi:MULTISPECIES: peptidoglycan-associated lipoprotein Pal [Sphingomonas]|uniref:Peptidoglycan-associated lipoprotein n=1 Tax=Sphingomonas leidyi TaxID=68569 RepID=A0A7X5V1L9_9SPHN|nr:MULTISPECIES: peptidoglycan-associated lipoprotein Pal [Sphingomonas]MBN8813271.1 peptidoglycan-associated lipoprotein Pal [Sphingomonas sp.]NIJ66243.1 peptidoglycan-associated lipoprotein [Sphingomonas leidyi]OJY53329.1 MAG: peptidoglycan-associated lipoprotein [Sphingomonas sp. 67-41]